MNTEFPVVVEAELLVIGYGNSLRCDDGVGPRVVEAMAALKLPGVRTLECQQLSPEHADLIARARRVIFVDAAVDDSSGVKFRSIVRSDTSQLMAHAASPATMLALARDVFGRQPEAWWLTIPAKKLEFGQELTPAAKAGCRQAVREITRLADGFC